MGTASYRQIRSKLREKEGQGPRAGVTVTNYKDKWLGVWYNLGMERSQLWVAPRAELCVQGRSGRKGLEMKEDLCDVEHLLPP